MSNYIKSSLLFICVLSFFISCGEAQRDKENGLAHKSFPQKGAREEKLNEKNFFNIARYHYLRELTYGNVKRAPLSGDSKVMRHLRSNAGENEEGVFYVKTVKSPDNVIYHMSIKCDGKVIRIELGRDKKSVTVTYTERGKEIVKKADLSSFTDTGINIKNAEEGEKI